MHIISIELCMKKDTFSRIKENKPVGNMQMAYW
jgi:hypothetical protein